MYPYPNPIAKLAQDPSPKHQRQNTVAKPGPDPTAITEGLRLLNNSDYSDLTLICGDRSWKVHRVIVCGRCDFFKACVDRNFQGQEAIKGVIDLPEDDPDAIEFMLTYLYTYDLDTCLRGLPEARKGQEELAFLMYSTSDKYMIPVLQRYWYAMLEESAKFTGCLQQSQTSIPQLSEPKFSGEKVANFLSLAYSCPAPGVDRICHAAISTLYNSGPIFRSLIVKDKDMVAAFQEHANLRKAFLYMIVTKDPTQKPLRQLLTHGSVASTVAQNPDIGIELIQNLVDPNKFTHGIAIRGT